jgi:GMP synthase (glutamine-hydrolysing)
MILIIDNTKNLNKAYMTPKLIECLVNHNIKYLVASDRTEVNKLLSNNTSNIKGIILSGGPLCLSEELTISSINKNIVALFSNLPVLGICFGFQIMAASYGGKIDSMEQVHQGIKNIKIDITSMIFKGLSNEIDAFESHRDKLVEVPPNFNVISMSSDGIIQGIENMNLKRWGVQFHPEGLETSNKIILNFVNYCL